MTSLKGVHKLRLTAKESLIAICEILDVLLYIASLFSEFLQALMLKANAASLKVTDLLFAFRLFVTR